MSLYMTLSGINIILILGRILKLMDFQPRLGVITHTLSLAFADLMHFFVIFIMVFMGYAFIGHVIFADSIPCISATYDAFDQLAIPEPVGRHHLLFRGFQKHHRIRS